MGWTFPWASSFGSDFNGDFDVALTEEQERAGAFEYNFRESPVWAPPEDMRGPFDAWAATTGTDWATYTRGRRWGGTRRAAPTTRSTSSAATTSTTRSETARAGPLVGAWAGSAALAG